MPGRFSTVACFRQKKGHLYPGWPSCAAFLLQPSVLLISRNVCLLPERVMQRGSEPGPVRAPRFRPVATAALRIADSLQPCLPGLRNRLPSCAQRTAVPGLSCATLSDGVGLLHLALTMATAHCWPPVSIEHDSCEGRGALQRQKIRRQAGLCEPDSAFSPNWRRPSSAMNKG